MEVGEQDKSVPDGWAVVPAASAPSAKTTGYWEQRGVGGMVWHPGEGGSDTTRVDNSVLGMPPELAVAGAIPAVRAIAGAVAGATTTGGRVLAGAKAAATAAAPQLKYEATKTLLEKMGVPTPLAISAALAVSGYKRSAPSSGGAAEPMAAEATPAAAAPASPGAAGPVAPAPPAAPAIPAGNPLPPAAASPAPAMPAAQGMPKLTSAETSEFLRLQKQGKSMKDAFDLIAAQRAFAQRFGLPTAGDVRNAVVDRNAAGRWPEQP